MMDPLTNCYIVSAVTTLEVLAGIILQHRNVSKLLRRLDDRFQSGAMTRLQSFGSTNSDASRMTPAAEWIEMTREERWADMKRHYAPPQGQPPKSWKQIQDERWAEMRKRYGLDETGGPA